LITLLTQLLILSVDTAARAGSVCLARGEQVLCALSLEAQSSHSAHLLETIQQALESASCALNDVELFAVAAGPGSFTGLRIGIATVKSFAAVTGRPCVGVPTLQAIASAAGPSAHTVALLPAGRGELFTQLFAVDAEGNAQPLDEPQHLKPLEAWDKYSNHKRLRWAGEGSLVHADALRDHATAQGIDFSIEFDETEGASTQGWIVARSCDNLAPAIAAIALQEFQQGKTVSADELRAIYVRPSDAEINQKWSTPTTAST
jgi:tRNA threonylcarbamoyladenosine biosynthesis protein TsaB